MRPLHLIVISIIVGFFPFFVFGQRTLSRSIKHSPFTHIYKLTPAQAQYLCAKGLLHARKSHLQNRIDSFPTNTDPPELPDGNYLFLHADQNKLVYELKTIGSVGIKIVSDDRQSQVLVHTINGTLIPDAEVHFGNNKLSYNNNTQTYGPTRHRSATSVRVLHNGVSYYYATNNLAKTSRFPGTLLNKFPAKQLRNVFSRILHSHDHRVDFTRYPTKHERRFSGYMVYSKPLYRPRDTVRFKAFIATRKGRFVSKPLLVRLSDDYLDKDTILALINPYRPGGYEFAFALSDSLDLDLDDRYLVTLEKQRSRKFDLRNYDGDLDDEEYAAKRKVLMRQHFKYEEYELGSIKFNARRSIREHIRGEENAVFLKAVDDNNLDVMDGRVEIIVTPIDTESATYDSTGVFIADTLWNYSQALESAGETKIVLPDSIFPAASFDYNIQCRFRNTNNELLTQNLRCRFINDSQLFRFSVLSDTLNIRYLQFGKEGSTSATLYALQGNDTIQSIVIQVPAKIRIHPYATGYIINNGKTIASEKLSDRPELVSCLANRTADSVFVKLINPASIPVWYSIFAGNRLVKSGYGRNWNFSARSVTRSHYFVSIAYLHNNKVNKQNFVVPFQRSLLTVEVTAPTLVRPGETTSIQVKISDVNGRPVENADITAYSITSKFDSRPPFVPYLGRQYPMRRQAINYLINDEREKLVHTSLDWKRWHLDLQLDTVEYYRFLHPKKIYVVHEPARDSITQLAPYLVRNGNMETVYLLYIDGAPVYFAFADHLKRYSFPVTKGKHSVKFRTRDREVMLDSIFIPEHTKTFFSIDIDSLPPFASSKKMPDTLTNREKILWNRYMIAIEKNGGNDFVTVRQGNRYFVLGNKPNELIGPLSNYPADYKSNDEVIQVFNPEGGFYHRILPRLIRQREFRRPLIGTTRLGGISAQTDLEDFVLTGRDIDSLWTAFIDDRSRNWQFRFRPQSRSTYTGKLLLEIIQKPNAATDLPNNIVLFRKDNPDYVRIYPGSTTNLGSLDPGYYRVLMLFSGDRYFLAEEIFVRGKGTNLQRIVIEKTNPADSFIRPVRKLLDDIVLGRSLEWHEVDNLKQQFNNRYLDPSVLTEYITGRVTNDKGEPVSNATISLSGTRHAVSTDNSGNFMMKVTRAGSIIASAIGYNSVAHDLVQWQNYYTFILQPTTNSLSEVIVTAYGTERKRNQLAYSQVVASGEQFILAGKLAGVSIRGSSTLASGSALIVIDGVPFAGQLSDIDPGFISNITTLSADAAVSIYGSRAAGGAIIISTKKSLAQDEPAGGSAYSLRKNFRDDAFWKPALRTGKDGTVEFGVTFPDDITGWNTYALATASGKKTGSTSGFIRSFQSVSGSIFLPPFVVQGDTMHIIGKIMNYQPDPVKLKRVFSVNGVKELTNELSVKNSWVDTMRVSSGDGDSLNLQYMIEERSGYFDGEERKIPVVRAGTLETKGIFSALTTDTTIVVDLYNRESQPNARGEINTGDEINTRDKIDTGDEIKIYAESSLLPVIYSEAEKVRTYEYLCNEQLASKLLALLAQKAISKVANRSFQHERNITEIIALLNKSKIGSGLWDWWSGDTPVMWISLHVANAMIEAEKNGYKTSLQKQLLIDYLLFNIESFRGTEKIAGIDLLHKLGAKIDYKLHLDSVERQSGTKSLYDRLRIAELRIATGESINIDSLVSLRSESVFGNYYWGRDEYQLFDNSVQNSLIMYRILKRLGGYESILKRIRNYFLERKRSGTWQNTYESALIISTILPDLIAENPSNQPATLEITGKETIRVNQYPFSTTIKNEGKISVSKKGTMPVYFTAYSQRWNPAPSKTHNKFKVDTWFEQNKLTVKALTAGMPVVLKAKVSVDSDAEYLMVEIPIPAGCSYQDKTQSGVKGEVHREYFKNKVSIFCKQLNKGTHEFSISLLPRYSGKYSLNPARAEMMYFPVFYGQESIKKVVIE